MSYTSERLNQVFDRTDGYCHICHGRLSFAQYGRPGGWEVEHSVPKSRGGTDRLSNLYAAHVSCNRAKRADSTRSARRKRGKTRAPHSVQKRAELRKRNAALGFGGGVALGAMIGGPPGALIGGTLGALLGHDKDPGR
jgi:hypothetical protein